jgi:hypothetical protein
VKSAEDGTVHHRDPEHLNSRNRQGIAVIPVFHFPAVQNGPNNPGCLRKEGNLAKCPPDPCALNLADLGSENGAATVIIFAEHGGRLNRHEDFAAKHENGLILRAKLSLIRSPAESSTDHITLCQHLPQAAHFFKNTRHFMKLGRLCATKRQLSPIAWFQQLPDKLTQKNDTQYLHKFISALDLRQTTQTLLCEHESHIGRSLRKMPVSFVSSQPSR